MTNNDLAISGSATSSTSLFLFKKKVQIINWAATKEQILWCWLNITFCHNTHTPLALKHKLAEYTFEWNWKNQVLSNVLGSQNQIHISVWTPGEQCFATSWKERQNKKSSFFPLPLFFEPSLSTHIQVISQFQNLCCLLRKKLQCHKKPKKIVKTYQLNITGSDIIFLVILSTHGIPSL